jgi:hypothetical protein
MPPVIAIAADLVPDAIVAIAMVVVEVYLLTQLLPRTGPPPLVSRMIIASAALLGSAGLLMSIMWAFLNSNLSNYTLVLLLFNFMMLGPPGVWLISVVVFEDDRIDPLSWVWPIGIAAMATAAEVLMGLLFTIANATSLAPVPIAAGTLTSAWFLWSMSAAMIAMLLWVPLSQLERYPLLGLAVSGAVAPWVVATPLVGVGLVALVMGITLFGTYRLLHRIAPTPTEATRLLGLALGFTIMMVAGLAAALVPSSAYAELAFGLATAAVMVGEFLFLLREGLRPRADAPAPTVEQLAPTPRFAVSR